MSSNFTGLDLSVTEVMPYAPDNECFDWCSIQHVVHSNNMELYGILFIVFAYLFIVLYNISEEINILKPYRESFIYYAKILLLLFFGFYIFIIRMRLIW